MEHALGRLYAPDKRDNRYPLRLVSPIAAAPVSHYRYWRTGIILDQANLPHCVGYAWQQWLMTSPIRQAKRLDPAQIYGEAQREDEWPGEAYEGTSVRAGAKILQRWGYIGSYLWASHITEIRDWLLTMGPVVLGTNWYANMFDGCWITTPTGRDLGFWVEPFGPLVGGHAYIAIGYAQNRKAFRCVNSWGKDWGQNGRFWIAEEHLAQLLQQQGEACTALEIKLEPAVVV